METREQFNRWVHRFGRISCAIMFLAMTAFPIVASGVYGIWPKFNAIWPGIIAVVLFMAPWWPGETIGYMPVMGAGALYLSYIAGNTTNLRMPATVGTINALGIEANTDECHTMAIIACGASVITTTVIMLLGLFAAVPLQPVLQAEPLQPAFNYAVPAIFGGLVAQTIFKGAKQIKLFLVPLALCLFFHYATTVNSAYYMLIAIALSAVIYVWSYRREKGGTRSAEYRDESN